MEIDKNRLDFLYACSDTLKKNVFYNYVRWRTINSCMALDCSFNHFGTCDNFKGVTDCIHCASISNEEKEKNEKKLLDFIISRKINKTDFNNYSNIMM